MANDDQIRSFLRCDFFFSCFSHLRLRILVKKEEEEESRKRGRKKIDRMSRVIEHNRKAGPRSAGGTLAGTEPPILR